MIIGVWSDSALYNSPGEEIEDEEDLLKEEDRHKVRSQAGALVACFSADDEDKLGDIKLSTVDWRTRATKRVVTSTFAAETSAACNGLGLGLYIGAMICEIYHGPVMAATQWGEDIMRAQLLTDCKSLYDHMARDSKLPEDRWTAIHGAALRSAVSAGPGGDTAKCAMRWVASRHQLADGLTKRGLSERMRELMRTGTTRLHEISAQEAKRWNKKEQ